MTAKKSADTGILEGLIEKFGSRTSIGALFAMQVTLEMLNKGERPSINDIAELTGTPRQTISRWVSHHVKRGWIQLESNPDDAREKYIRATDRRLLSSKHTELRKLLGSSGKI